MTEKAEMHIHMVCIVIKPGLGPDPAKGPGPGFHGSTRINQQKFKKK
jgi:hypothetical protein